MKTYSVTFDFAMWKLNNAKKDIERIKHSKFISTRSDYNKSGCRDIVLSKLSQTIEYWQSIAAILCPKHEWENEEGNDYPPFKCRVCGFVESDYDALYYTREAFTQGCHNCANLEKEGGDSVPYGLGSATLPEYEYCVSEDLPVMTCDSEEDDLEYFQEEFMKEDVICPLWGGK